MYEMNRLYFIREKLDLTQKDISTKLHVSRAYYASCESNRKYMTLKLLNEFCNIYSSTLDYIFHLSNSNDTKHIIQISELNKNIISKNLKIILTENHLTQKQVATFLNTSQSTISAYVNGKTIILTAFAIQLAKKYNFSLDWLIGRSNNKFLN